MNPVFLRRVATALAPDRLEAYRQDGVGQEVALARYLLNMALCEALYLDGPNAKPEFAALLSQKEQIEKALGFPLGWHNPENKAMCRIFTRQDADFLKEALWPQHFEWIRQRLEKMHKVFSPIVKDLKFEAAE